VEELYEKYEELKTAKGSLLGQKMMDVEEHYKSKLKTKDEYFEGFSEKLDKLLEV
jgi:hypothetical protein